MGTRGSASRQELVGEHWVTSILAAVACGIACDISLRTCASVVEKFEPIFGRYSVHRTPKGAVYILDTLKAPYWTIPAGLSFVGQAQAPRKTVVVGTISDHAGASSPKYRSVAREALKVADRVVFVGPNAGHVSKLRQDELGEKLFVFQTSYQASAFLSDKLSPGELVYIKASRSDHLERVMLSVIDQVVCWRERCKVPDTNCLSCRNFRTPHAPPFGLASGTARVRESEQCSLKPAADQDG